MTNIYGIDEQGLEYVNAATRIAETIRGQAPEVDKLAAFPRAAIKMLADGGLPGLCIPVDSGGKGQSPAVFAGVVEQLSQACPSTAMIYVMHVSASQAFVATQTLAGREALLKEIAAGKHLTTLAFSERGSRSQFWAPVSKLATACLRSPP